MVAYQSVELMARVQFPPAALLVLVRVIEQGEMALGVACQPRVTSW